jgi:hypothetical protein
MRTKGVGNVANVRYLLVSDREDQFLFVIWTCRKCVPVFPFRSALLKIWHFLQTGMVQDMKYRKPFVVHAKWHRRKISQTKYSSVLSVNSSVQHNYETCNLSAQNVFRIQIGLFSSVLRILISIILLGLKVHKNENFSARFLILYYFIVSSAEIFRFVKKIWLGSLLGEIRLFRLVWN